MVRANVQKPRGYRPKRESGFRLDPVVQFLAGLADFRVFGCSIETVAHDGKTRLPFFQQVFFEPGYLAVEKQVLTRPLGSLRESAVVVPLCVLYPVVSDSDGTELPDEEHFIECLEFRIRWLEVLHIGW